MLVSGLHAGAAARSRVAAADLVTAPSGRQLGKSINIYINKYRGIYLFVYVSFQSFYFRLAAALCNAKSADGACKKKGRAR